MTYAHDYYGQSPDLHNRGEEAMYLDYGACDCMDQLPLISTIGRGPKGEGLYVGNVVSTDDEVSFGLYSTDTDELVWQSPNMAPAQISFKPTDWRDLVPGVHADLDITVTTGGTTKTTTAYIPAGQPGSLIYLLPDEMERTADDTYTVDVDALTIYGKKNYPSKPMPRANDIVFFKYKDTNGYGWALGTIEAVEDWAADAGTATVKKATFTARTFIQMPPIAIGENGHWLVDGVDTGVSARGDKGDKGDKGNKGDKGAQGEKGDKGDKGEAGKAATITASRTIQLDPGATAYVANYGTATDAMLEFGIPEGKPAKIASIDVDNLPKDGKAYGEATQVSSNENSWAMKFGLPRGEDGATFDVKNGVWELDDLPDFDTTPINTVYIVRWDNDIMHAYIRGREAYDAELGGPWTVVDVSDFWALNNNPLTKDDDGHLSANDGYALAMDWVTDSNGNRGIASAFADSSAIGSGNVVLRGLVKGGSENTSLNGRVDILAAKATPINSDGNYMTDLMNGGRGNVLLGGNVQGVDASQHELVMVNTEDPYIGLMAFNTNICYMQSNGSTANRVNYGSIATADMGKAMIDNIMKEV